METQKIINELDLDEKIKQGNATAQDFVEGVQPATHTKQELKEMFYNDN